MRFGPTTPGTCFTVVCVSRAVANGSEDFIHAVIFGRGDGDLHFRLVDSRLKARFEELCEGNHSHTPSKPARLFGSIGCPWPGRMEAFVTGLSEDE